MPWQLLCRRPLRCGCLTKKLSACCRATARLLQLCKLRRPRGCLSWFRQSRWCDGFVGARCSLQPCCGLAWLCCTCGGELRVGLRGSGSRKWPPSPAEMQPFASKPQNHCVCHSTSSPPAPCNPKCASSVDSSLQLPHLPTPHLVPCPHRPSTRLACPQIQLLSAPLCNGAGVGLCAPDHSRCLSLAWHCSPPCTLQAASSRGPGRARLFGGSLRKPEKVRVALQRTAAPCLVELGQRGGCHWRAQHACSCRRLDGCFRTAPHALSPLSPSWMRSRPRSCVRLSTCSTQMVLVGSILRVSSARSGCLPCRGACDPLTLTLLARHRHHRRQGAEGSHARPGVPGEEG